MPDHLCGSLVAKEQRECVNENGFSGPGFAGKKIEPGSKFHRYVVNDGVIFNPQFEKHGEDPESGSDEPCRTDTSLGTCEILSAIAPIADRLLPIEPRLQFP